MDFQRISVGERSLRVQRSGRGTPVVYMHGGLGSIHERPASDELIARLDIELVRIERPGFGDSSRHAGRTLADWAGDVRAVLDALGLGRVGILGWSGGVPHALATAAFAADRVAAVALVGAGLQDPAWVIDPHDAAAYARFVEQTTAMIDAMTKLAVQPRMLADAILGTMPEVDRALPDEVRAMLATSYAEALRSAGGAMDEMVALRTPWPFAPAQVTCPVTVWTGALDRNTPLAGAQALVDALPRARHEVIAERGHNIVFTHSEAILAALRDEVRAA
jgi:pimeloyl-ACP methyl ester carboxylesterase